ncbi:DUF4339 domain-containing protein [Pararobbsia alpina]|uniref:GYF domain-containing protein n=1 Tax=Pararobbsia alpina TaxID=621374 RepID=A0A6S7BHH1_9BURK|nr:DUF4339 domain-containing protein [Pararobbsia alpina]CAB3800594.1 hypothetical protein LMG28138_04860 [Pararobbsia alpina]
MSSWHYEQHGERHGPVSADDIAALVNNRGINAQTLVWQQGFHDWMPLSQTRLATHLSNATAPPALPGSRINNGIVWTLAFAPWLGLALQGVLAGVFSDNAADLSSADLAHSWYATLMLNVGLSIFDVRQLKKAGVDTARIDRFAFLVPVYLWKRFTAEAEPCLLLGLDRNIHHQLICRLTITAFIGRAYLARIAYPIHLALNIGAQSAQIH